MACNLKAEYALYDVCRPYDVSKYADFAKPFVYDGKKIVDLPFIRKGHLVEIVGRRQDDGFLAGSADALWILTDQQVVDVIALNCNLHETPLPKIETTQGLGPGPSVIGESGFQQMLGESGPKISVGIDGSFDATADAASRVRSGLPVSISMVSASSVELRAVVVYYRRKLRSGLVRLYFHPVKGSLRSDEKTRGQNGRQ